ncbi:hypothetical protein BC628DRAFT_1328868 [Trametes gibbosa]|nr:hypothetical protein BC628DRAFT_1328868 [Trametes gibbosa]
MLLSEAAVFSTTFEAILYGLSVFLFMLTLWVLLRNRKRRRINWAMVCASTALLAFSTMETVVNIVRLYEGFVEKGPKLPGGPETYFGDVWEVSFVLKNALYNVQTLILDGVVIYRTYKVWNSLLVIVIPVLGWLGLLTSSVGLGFSLARTPAVSEDIFEVGTSHWFTGTWSTTLVTNICATAALAYRIWQVTSKSAQYRSGGRLSPILRIIVESGAIYSITVIIALALFLARSNWVYIILDMISPIICIVFNMIIVRIGLAADGTLIPETTQPVPAPAREAGSRSAPVVRQMVRRQATVDLETKDINIAVEIAQFVEGDVESRCSVDSLCEGRKNDCISSIAARPALPTPTRSSILLRDMSSGAGGVSMFSERTMAAGHSKSQIHVVTL